MSGPNATVWQPNNKEGEFTNGTANGLVDSAAVQLVDASAVSLFDSGTIFTPIPLTIWSLNDTA